jgi:8-oxo-dGTP pyrophosphatase MutT (NUDIX family)
MTDIVYGALAIPYRVAGGKIEFLLLKHQSGMWTFPGGGKDPDDMSLEDCLIRELAEEIGLTIKKDRLVPTGLVNRFTYGPEKPSRNGMKGETHFWLLKLNGNEEFSSWDKIIDHGWFSSDEIIERLAFPDEKSAFQSAIKVLVV